MAGDPGFSRCALGFYRFRILGGVGSIGFTCGHVGIVADLAPREPHKPIQRWRAIAKPIETFWKSYKTCTTLAYTCETYKNLRKTLKTYKT